MLKPLTSTEFWYERIDLVWHTLEAPETPGPWDGYPCRWRGDQTGRISARPWCHVGLPAEYGGSYQQVYIGQLLSSPRNSTTSKLSGQGLPTKTRVGFCVVEDRSLHRRTRRITCETSLAPLQRVINAVARFIASLLPRDYVSHILLDLHWHPIRERISNKACLMMLNIVNGIVPTYMTGMVTRISDLPGRCYLRSAAEGLFNVPRARTVFGSMAFSVAGPVAWNGLSTHVWAIHDVAFKSAHLAQLRYL